MFNTNKNIFTLVKIVKIALIDSQIVNLKSWWAQAILDSSQKNQIFDDRLFRQIKALGSKTTVTYQRFLALNLVILSQPI